MASSFASDRDGGAGRRPNGREKGMALRSRLNHLILVSSEQDAFADALWRQLRLEAMPAGLGK